MTTASILPLSVLLLLLVTARAQTSLELQKAANQALQSQLSKEGKDCPQAHDNSEDQACISLVVQGNERDLATFLQVTRI